MATTIQSEVPMAGSVAKMVNRLSKVEDPIVKVVETRKQLHIVIYEYKAQASDEIDMEVNDIIEIMKTVEDGWNRGLNQRTGLIGMYPTNYCEVYRLKGGLGTSGVSKHYVALKKTEGVAAPASGEVPAAIKRISGMEGLKEEESGGPVPHKKVPFIPPSPPSLRDEEKEKPEKEYARVTFDYEAQHEDELSLKVGQTVWVTKKNTTDSGWYEGEVDGRRGLFPDNFVSLIKPSNGMGSSTSGSALSSHPSSLPECPPNLPKFGSRLSEKAPAFLPGAVSVMPLPPQVPAKPPKSMGGVGNGVSGMSGVSTTPSMGNGPPGWKTTPAVSTLSSTTPSTTATPSTNTVPVAVPSTTPSLAREEEKDVIRPPPSFKDKQANLLASLNISSLNPSMPRPAASLSKSTTRIDEEGVADENGEATSKETPLLSHPTKNRPKVPSGVRRPVSMFPPPSSDFVSSTSKDGMSRSEVVLTEHPATIGSSTSLSPSALTVSPPLPPKEKETAPSIVSSSRSSTGTPTPISINHTILPDIPLESSQSQWVSRAEYNQLLAKVALLEDRLAALEHF